VFPFRSVENLVKDEQNATGLSNTSKSKELGVLATPLGRRPRLGRAFRLQTTVGEETLLL